MHKDTVIKVDKVSKKFCKTLKHVMLYGALDITRDFFSIKTKTHNLRNGEFWAVEDVSFELKKGETIGIIGVNGSGKSTLLRMLNGIYMPDKGQISIKGRIGALIAVGAGFHPMLTGRENVYVNGQILGMSKKEIDRKFDSIIDFAEIGDFIDAPVKHYSSGMFVRLGFSVAIHCDPDILLVDEILAVGDYNFQLKCQERIKELRKDGVAIVLVSHNEISVKNLCQRGVLLHYGKEICQGDVDEALTGYFKIQNEATKKTINKKQAPLQTLSRRGDGRVRFQNVEFRDLKGREITQIPFGTEKIIIHAKYFAYERVENVNIAVYLRDAEKQDWVFVTGASTKHVINIDYMEGEGEIEFTLSTSNLGVKLYGLYMGIGSSDTEISFDIWDINDVFLEVVPSEKYPNNLLVTKPYIISDFNFKHKRNTVA